MAAFVLVSLALAVFTLGLVGVAGVLLWRAVQHLGRAVGATGGRLQPLLDELQAEAAVASTELEHLQRRVQRTDASNLQRRVQRTDASNLQRRVQRTDASKVERVNGRAGRYTSG